MPLIECFLTVCGSTSLRVPTVESSDDIPVIISPTSATTSSSTSSSSTTTAAVIVQTEKTEIEEEKEDSVSGKSTGKRKAETDTPGISIALEVGTGTEVGKSDVNTTLPVTTTTTTTVTSSASVTVTEMETVLDSKEIDSLAIVHAVRALSDTVPGARFRNNSGYLQMQLELDETSPAAPLLLRFADRNRVLLNMVLRNNIHLLESSFSALVTVPRCRHLLHFDIKR